MSDTDPISLMRLPIRSLRNDFPASQKWFVNPVTMANLLEAAESDAVRSDLRKMLTVIDAGWCMKCGAEYHGHHDCQGQNGGNESRVPFLSEGVAVARADDAGRLPRRPTPVVAMMARHFQDRSRADRRTSRKAKAKLR